MKDRSFIKSLIRRLAVIIWNLRSKRYTIYFDGLFEYGFVKLSFIKLPREVPLGSYQDGVDFGSKFIFRWYARFWNKFMNWHSERTCSMRKYKVLTVKKHA